MYACECILQHIFYTEASPTINQQHQKPIHIHMFCCISHIMLILFMQDLNDFFNFFFFFSFAHFYSLIFFSAFSAGFKFWLEILSRFSLIFWQFLIIMLFQKVNLSNPCSCWVQCIGSVAFLNPLGPHFKGTQKTVKLIATITTGVFANHHSTSTWHFSTPKKPQNPIIKFLNVQLTAFIVQKLILQC